MKSRDFLCSERVEPVFSSAHSADQRSVYGNFHKLFPFLIAQYLILNVYVEGTRPLFSALKARHYKQGCKVGGKISGLSKISDSLT